MEPTNTPATTDQSLNPSNGSFPASLEEIVIRVNIASRQCKDNPHQILELLRTLEQLHQEIRVNLFEPSLPNTRNDLYDLLLDIEETGGWPYIGRMKLRMFLEHFSSDIEQSSDSE
ncbi:hypothetical protein [Crocosphaera chwakensis]|uniref:Uncharacterized protein n=1 Tax=Crocosphaera chwakensis CCY0110 TaxID=391612 RepID=A3IUE1_9CHRO|nr:hypothetical protein [Crocosphaera chwakensis]EAZ89922.1 hypothetical protein CY0110_14038 [Crocosphaera chwakensis CCY0110]